MSPSVESQLTGGAHGVGSTVYPTGGGQYVYVPTAHINLCVGSHKG